MLLAEAWERWDTAAKGEGAGRQHKGHSEEAGRVRLHGERERGSDMKGDARLHPLITMLRLPPAKAVSKRQRVLRGDTCG